MISLKIKQLVDSLVSFHHRRINGLQHSYRTESWRSVWFHFSIYEVFFLLCKRHRAPDYTVASSHGGLKTAMITTYTDLIENMVIKLMETWNRSEMPDFTLYSTRKWQHVSYDDNKALLVTILHQYFFSHFPHKPGLSIKGHVTTCPRTNITVEGSHSAIHTQVQICILEFGRLILVKEGRITNEFYQFFHVSLCPS